MRSRMCGWYDVKVRGILGSEKRDEREIEILGRRLRWTGEGLEYEARDKHSQAQWKEWDWARRKCWRERRRRGSGAWRRR